MVQLVKRGFLANETLIRGITLLNMYTDWMSFGEETNVVYTSTHCQKCLEPWQSYYWRLQCSLYIQFQLFKCNISIA